MSNDNNLIFKNTIILYIRLIFTSLLGFLSSRFIINGLGAADYGLYSVVGSVVIMMAFLNTVMISTTYRYIAYEMGKGSVEGVNKVFNISLIIHIILALLILLLTETIGIFYVKNHLNVKPDKIFDAVFVLRFSTYLTVLNIFSIPFQGLITAQEKFSIKAIIEILRSSLNFIVALSIIYFAGNRLRLYSGLMALVSALISIILYIYCKRKFNKIIQWNLQKDKAKYKEMICFSGWIIFGAAASVGQKSLSALIINSFFGTILNAAYGIANTINGIINAFSGSLGQAVVPQITKSYSSGNNTRSVNLTAYISKYSTFMLLIISVPVLLETKFLITLWLGKVPPPYTIIMSQLVIVNSIVISLGGGLSSLVQATGKIKWFQIILSTTSLLSLPLAYILFKSGFPPYTIIFTFIFTGLINVVVRQILLKKIIGFNVKYFIKITYLKVFYVIISVLPLFYISSLFDIGLMRFILSTFISTVVIVVVIYFAGLDKIEKKIFKDAVLQLKTRLWKK